MCKEAGAVDNSSAAQQVGQRHTAGDMNLQRMASGCTTMQVRCLSPAICCLLTCLSRCHAAPIAAGKGSISGADFANSLVTAADVRKVDTLLDKVRHRAAVIEAAHSEKLAARQIVGVAVSQSSSECRVDPLLYKVRG
jgi:hypothetical protein